MPTPPLTDYLGLIETPIPNPRVGDMLYRDVNGGWTTLGPGAPGQIMTLDPVTGLPVWRIGASAVSLINVKDPIYGAKADNATDDTAAINNALSVGSVYIPPGEYYINGIVSIPIATDFIGAGSGQTKFRLGPNGQIAHSGRAVSGGVGGTSSGFYVDGDNGVGGRVAGGGMYIGNTLNRIFQGIVVQYCYGDGVVIETAQNDIFNSCQFQICGGSSLVLDYGAGGHLFNRCEFGGASKYGVELRQTGQSVGGYPTFLGPSGNTFVACIGEYPGAATLAATITALNAGNLPAGVAPGQFYHGAGNNNQAFGCSWNMQGQAGPGSVVIMESAANAIFLNANLVSGNQNITITAGDITQISTLMAVSGPGIVPGTFVEAINGQIVQLSVAPQSSTNGATVGFGSISNQLSMDGAFIYGVQGETVGFDIRGSQQLNLSGHTVIEGQTHAFKIAGSDTVMVSGPIEYISVTDHAVQQPGDVWAFQPNSQISFLMDNGFSVVTRDNPHNGMAAQRHGDNYPYFSVGGGSGAANAAVGVIYLGNGNDPLGGALIQYFKDTDGLVYVQIPGPFVAEVLKASGLAGATTQGRFCGIYGASVSPPNGTWETGDWVLLQNGQTALCTAGGTPGTWVVN